MTRTLNKVLTEDVGNLVRESYRLRTALRDLHQMVVSEPDPLDVDDYGAWLTWRHEASNKALDAIANAAQATNASPATGRQSNDAAINSEPKAPVGGTDERA